MGNFKKLVTILSVLFLITLCLFFYFWRYFQGCYVWEYNCLFPSPEINIKASATRGEAPLEVEFTADISGYAKGHKDISCPDEQWEYGDGDGYLTLGSDCAYPLPRDVNTSFSKRHTYKKPGVYEAYLKLSDKVTSNKIQITVE